MTKTKKLVIVGLGETADIAFEYFTYDSDYEVIAFSVNREFIDKKSYSGLPVVPLEDLTTHFPVDEVEVYVAISYVKLNRVRKKLFHFVKSMGYTCANYVSSKAFVWRNVTMGENNFIFENNVIQHKVMLGNNIILWSGNHIGHQTKIMDHAYLSSHCVVSGFCEIGESSFLGVNCTMNDQIKLAADTLIGSGSLVIRNTEKGQLIMGSPGKPAARSSYEAFNVNLDEI